MRKRLFIFTLITMICLSGCGSLNQTKLPVPEYPLRMDTVKEALNKVELPCDVVEESIDSVTRTGITLRDNEGRLVAGIASESDGDIRFIGVTLVGYLMQGEASVFLTEEYWNDVIELAGLLYGDIPDEKQVYKDFMNNFETESIITEYESNDNSSYIKEYEWIKKYDDVYFSILVRDMQDGNREINNLKFYNSETISNTRSEMRGVSVLNTLFTGPHDLYKNYSHYYTEECFKKLEESDMFTFIRDCAVDAVVETKLKDIDMKEQKNVFKTDKNKKSYDYTVTLECSKNDTTWDVDIKGSMIVENLLNGWKVTEITVANSEEVRREIQR